MVKVETVDRQAVSVTVALPRSEALRLGGLLSVMRRKLTTQDNRIRPALEGVQFLALGPRRLRLTATNGYALARITMEVDVTDGALSGVLHGPGVEAYTVFDRQTVWVLAEALGSSTSDIGEVRRLRWRCADPDDPRAIAMELDGELLGFTMAEPFPEMPKALAAAEQGLRLTPEIATYNPALLGGVLEALGQVDEAVTLVSRARSSAYLRAEGDGWEGEGFVMPMDPDVRGPKA